MTQQKYRRFTLAEVVLHALQAIIYIALFITGVILLLQRTFQTDWISPGSLSVLHRIMGIVLVIFLIQTFLQSLITPSFRILWGTIAEALKWKPSDIIWLIKAPFHFLFHRISLPPSGKFNPGQKLNILVVLTTVTGMSLSGIWMISVPGALLPWYIHVICFLFGSMLFVIHLYLSIVNPPTSKSITGMITGFVPLQYIRDHHPLCLNEPVPEKHHVHLHRLPAILLGIVVVTILLSGIYVFGPDRFILKGQQWAQSRGMLSLMPGPLTLSHAEAIKERQCLNCHNLKSRPASEKCIECHEIIAERIQNSSGYHGKLTGPCIDCHTEHQGSDVDIRPLDKASFNHQQANFHLSEKHAILACEKCHKVRPPESSIAKKMVKIRYIGIAHETCLTCHKNFHQDSRTEECLKCHISNSWLREDLKFEHNRDSRFVLRGKHITLACEKCHNTVRASGDELFRLHNIGMECKDCHTDPHAGQFEQKCNECHSELDWKSPLNKPFHTVESEFPLNGKHTALTCEKCHIPAKDDFKLASPKFIGLGTKCQSCHEDPHNAQMSHSCSTCHSDQGWKGMYLLFSHNEHSAFKLDSLHAGLSCDGCHTNTSQATRYRPLQKHCELCHNAQTLAMQGIMTPKQKLFESDPHWGRLACIDCHDTNITHQSTDNYAARCISCHNTLYGKLFYDWSKIFLEYNAKAASLLDNDIIQQLNRVRFHNLQMAAPIWKDAINRIIQTDSGTR
ncbi:MAG: cytochrome b/b6 domain-containing protein [Sedimentisphaerales bacterium]|nr:cytochrome b/b6 domain-containing protein [Sedimentisphaerales bacterium]